ncbi:TorF family putative porin [Sphingomonas sp. R647]|uniref:TorF family putative porin n=1 Tax=Sphingomonas sp. R647 TaxID=2875233 RepID=UPI001CD55203|nr:TorF family putative porin [Sphingomonas sp. R647]MCA1196444.1 TorF family putative porin [Sphingomonas sp. R647]
MIPLPFRPLIWLAAIFPVAAAGPSHARDVSAEVAIVTDYRFRGLSLSDHMPVIQGGVDVEQDGWQAQLWGSTRADGDAEGREIDLYVGRADSVGAFSYEVGARAYFVRGAPAYLEVTGQFSRQLGPVQIVTELSYAPEQAGLRDNLYGAVTLFVSPLAGLTLSGRAGIEDSAAYGPKSDWEVRAAFEAKPLLLSVAIVQARGQTLNSEERAPAGVFALQLGF